MIEFVPTHKFFELWTLSNARSRGFIVTHLDQNAFVYQVVPTVDYLVVVWKGGLSSEYRIVQIVLVHRNMTLFWSCGVAITRWALHLFVNSPVCDTTINPWGGRLPCLHHMFKCAKCLYHFFKLCEMVYIQCAKCLHPWFSSDAQQRFSEMIVLELNLLFFLGVQQCFVSRALAFPRLEM